jgi:hypothetical protein
MLWGIAFFAFPQQSERMSLLEPGEFHGNEVALVQPRDWLGLFCANSQCVARPVSITTKRVHDEIVDEDAKVNTGTLVSLVDQAEPLFLLHGLRRELGIIPTAFVGERGLTVDDRFTIGAPVAGYSLSVAGSKAEDDSLQVGTRLVFAHGATTQDLFIVPKNANDPYITVLWVGDLDGDGKPDLYLITSWHYNVSHRALWLFTRADKGQLVGLAAEFETTGC